MPYAHRETSAGPKKILTIDGGGIRGLISVQVLKRIEEIYRVQRGRADLVLSDEFDYFAGTSTGAIIAAGLALGRPVEEIETMYWSLAKPLFKKRPAPLKFWSVYSDGPLREALQDFFGADTTLGDDALQSLLLCVLLNATTDSPWPLSNCTTAKYNLRSRSDCNLELPLWKVVRASTAAPFYFPPETARLGPNLEHEFVFQDGGITSYNNPAFIAAMMATAAEYRLGWPTGPDNLLVVSIGTGSAAAASPGLERRDVHMIHNAKSLVGHLMNSASTEQDRLCRFLGHCRHGSQVDREVGTIVSTAPIAGDLFTYLRYNVGLDQQSLDDLGLAWIDSARVRKLDAVDALEELQLIGAKLADEVDEHHFTGFM